VYLYVYAWVDEWVGGCGCVCSSAKARIIICVCGIGGWVIKGIKVCVFNIHFYTHTD